MPQIEAEDTFKEVALKVRIKLLTDEMERAAVACCSHGESNAARDILLRAIEFNNSTPVGLLLDPMGDLAQDVREVLQQHGIGSSTDYIELNGK